MRIEIKDSNLKTIATMSPEEYDAMSSQERSQKFPNMNYAAVIFEEMWKPLAIKKFPTLERIPRQPCQAQCFNFIPLTES